MLRYLYADSSEFPLQRDFVDLLQRFSDVAVEALPTQEQVADLKRRIRDMDSKRESQLQEINRLGEAMAQSIGAVATDFGVDRYAAVAEGIRSAAEEKVAGFHESERQRFETVLEGLRKELAKRQQSLLQIVGEFLHYDPLSIAQVEISASLKDKLYDSQVSVTCNNGTSYVYDLDFSEKEKRVSDFTEKPVEVPAVMKQKVLSKEKRPRFISINDWIMTEALYRSNAETILRVTLAKGPGDKTRLEMELRPGETKLQCLVYVDDDGCKTDILKDDQLKRHLGKNLEEFAKYLLGHFYGLINKKKSINKVELDGADLVREDLTEKFIERTAKEYAPTIASIRQKGLVRGELNLKAEDTEGKRTERYLKIDEYRTKMSSVPQGSRICSMMGLD